ncbi:transposase family protein [Streptomyces sp. M10(2022)]
MARPTTYWPAGSASTAPPSRVQSVKCAPAGPAGLHRHPDVRLRSLAEVIEHLGASGQTGTIDGTEIRVRRPAAGRKDREKFISGKNKQNAVKSMVVTDTKGRLLFCSPAEPGSCADITHARQLGLVRLLAEGPAVEILADAGYQGLGAQTGGRVVTPPHRKFKKNPPEWYEQMHERQRKAHSSRRIRVEHGIGHLKNWRALARHHGRREHMSDIIQPSPGSSPTSRPPPWAAVCEREHDGQSATLDPPALTMHELVSAREAELENSLPRAQPPRRRTPSRELRPNHPSRRTGPTTCNASASATTPSATTTNWPSPHDLQNLRHSRRNAPIDWRHAC